MGCTDPSSKDGERTFFELRYLQARDPRLVGRPFRAVYSPDAAWIDDLELAPGTPEDIRAAVRAGHEPDQAPVTTRDS